MKIQKALIKMILLSATLFTFSCSKVENTPAEDSNNGAVLSAVTQINSIVSASEGGVAGFSATAATCNYSGYACSTASKAVEWNGCMIGAVTMTGSWAEEYSSPACCTSFGDSCSVWRKTGLNGSVITFSGGATLTTSSENHTTYDNTVMTALPYSTTLILSAGTRTLSVNALHRILRSSGNTILFNHSLRSTQNIIMTGTRAGANRVINSGVIELYNNIGKYKATTTFDTVSRVTWGNAACCHPTSGTVTTVFTGDKSGSTSMTFSSTCGNASFVDLDGATSTVTFDHCE